jgi:hypothetical protein
MPPVTGVVYCHPAISFVLEDGSYSVRATADIAPGTMLLLEHVVHGTMADMHSALRVDADLRDTLYPRREDRRGDDDDSEKILSNVFRFGDIIVLGNRASKFNHACRPNVYMTHADSVGDDRTYGFFAVARVKSGTELTIDYVNGHAEAHDAMKAKHGYACGCTSIDLDNSRRRWKTAFDMAHRFRDAAAADGTIPRLVDAYQATRAGKQTSKTQVKAREFAKRIVIVEAANAES